ncbi:MAG: glycoside hydrolase family 16 protein [Rhodothermales bacterium]|nr:glycoside hydrolase family 16 protein [Rhodothermales bacterium]
MRVFWSGLLIVLVSFSAACDNSTAVQDDDDDGVPQTIGDWQLVWNDEFEGDRVDTGKWSFQVGDGCDIGLCGWGNNELQSYTTTNASVEDGKLVITAERESVGGRDYTSARVRTANKGDWKYGRFEIRAKLPPGQGFWPAIWLLPTDGTYGGWAASGEIDIMEAQGQAPRTVLGTLHYGDTFPNNQSSGGAYSLPSGFFTDSFHTFVLEWSEGRMLWYVDDVPYQVQTEWNTVSAPFPAPFDQRFHLLLNVAVGGNFVGAPDGTTTFPQSMEVEYVRVYQKPDAQ